MTAVPIDRRTLLWALAAGAPLAACSENAETGRAQLVLVSDADLMRLSETAWRDLLTAQRRSADRAAQTRLEAIGARVARESGLDGVQWEFVLFDSPEINAFVLPGGKVGFFQGLVDLAGGDDEIAAVMGHEVGHVLARHAAERMSQQLAVQAGVTLAAAALSQSEEVGRYAEDIAGALGMGLVYGVVLPYSRSHELEADRLGLSLMADARFDPQAAPRFWRRMIETSAAGPEPLAWLSTHPANDARLEALEAAVAGLSPPAPG